MTTQTDLLRDDIQEKIKMRFPEVADYKIILDAIEDLLDEVEQASGIQETEQKRQKFIDRFGEDPVDVIGSDWEDNLDDFIDNANSEDERIDK